MRETIFNVFTEIVLTDGGGAYSFKCDINNWIQAREKEGYEVSSQYVEKTIKTSSFELCMWGYVWMQREKKYEN